MAQFARGELMSFNLQIRLFQLFVQLMGVYSLYYMITTGDYFWILVVIPAYILLGPVGIGLVLHRLLTHRTFTTYKWLENLLSFFSVFCTLGPTITWVGLHRYHHANSDTELDPHSPKHGKFRAWTGIGWTIPQIPLRYVKDLMKNPFQRFILDHYFKILILTILLVTMINPILVLFLYFLPCALAFHGVNAINVFGHTLGYRNYNTDDNSTNNLIVHALTWDGLHNNHHASPGDWNNKMHWWEFDPLAGIIKLIRK